MAKKVATKGRVIVSSRHTHTTHTKRRALVGHSHAAHPKAEVPPGKDVTIRESSAEAQIIYGRFQVGGVVTFVRDSENSYAGFTTGSGNSTINWVARKIGDLGNNIQIELILSGTHANTTVATSTTTDANGVATNTISVTLKSNSGVSNATANAVIAAVKANSTANSWVTVTNSYKSSDGKTPTDQGTGFCAQEALTNLTGGGGTWLHQYITLAGHRIDGIETLYIDKSPVVFGTGTKHPDPRWALGKYRDKIFLAMQNGEDSQLAQADLMAQQPGIWIDTDTQSGCAGCYMISVYNANVFPNGWPEVQFLVRGKPCYDPRDGTQNINDPNTYKWTQNAALICADFLNNSIYGFGVPYSKIDSTALSAAATICDQIITISNGATEPRYQINGIFDTSADRQSTLANLLAAMAGDLVYEAGLYYFFPGAWRAADLTLTADDLNGQVELKTHIQRSDSFNSVSGTFVDPASNYQATDYPAVSIAQYVAQDSGVQIFEDLTSAFVTSATQAQRIARIMIERERRGLQVTFPGKLTCLRAQCCETISLNLPMFGLTTAQTFEVRQVNISEQQDGTLSCDLTLRLVDSHIYDTGAEIPFTQSASTSLPDPANVTAPQSVTAQSGTAELYIRADGTVAPRILLTWNPSTSIYVIQNGEYEVQYKKSADANFNSILSVGGDVTSIYLTDVSQGVAYDIQIRSKNELGFVSAWSQLLGYVVIGKDERPGDVQNFSGAINSFGIVFSWQPVPDLDVSQYELRYGDVNSTWETANYIDLVSGTSYTARIQLAASYVFYIKAKDSSKNYSVNAAVVSAIIRGPDAPVVLIELVGSSVRFSWNTPNSLFAIDSFDIYYEATINGSTQLVVLANVKGTTYSTNVDFIGQRNFLVAARDIASNEGAFGRANITINPPGIVKNLTAQSIYNNVLLRWDANTSGSLPVITYKIFKGPVFASAALLGEFAGTFAPFFEPTGSDQNGFTYWVVEVDSALNVGQPSSINVQVAPPQDFILKLAGNIDPRAAITATNVYIRDFGFLLSTGGPGGEGSPIGCLAGITFSATPGGTGITGGPGGVGSPIGALAGITYAGAPPAVVGRPIGVLAGITHP